MKNALFFDVDVQLLCKILSLKWGLRRIVFFYVLFLFPLYWLYLRVFWHLAKCYPYLYFSLAPTGFFRLCCAYVQLPITIRLLYIYCEFTFGKCAFTFDYCITTIVQDFKLKMGPIFILKSASQNVKKKKKRCTHRCTIILNWVPQNANAQ